MRITLNRLAWAILLLYIFTTPHISVGQDPKGFRVLLTHDNDFLFIGNADENYTGGIKLELQTPWLKPLSRAFFSIKDQRGVRVSRFAVGGTGYTPQDLASREVVVGDRPYSSIMFVSAGVVSWTGDDRWMLSSEIVTGLQGAGGPGNFQKWLHLHGVGGGGRPVPQGWDNQIGHENSFFVNYNVRSQYNLFVPRSQTRKMRWIAAAAVGGIDLGNYMTNIQAGLRLNLINFNSSNFLNYDHTIPKIYSPGTERKPGVAAVRFNIFIEPIGRIPVYNASLEGKLFDDASVYVIPHDDVSRLILEVNAGLNIVIVNAIYLRYAASVRSQEFEGGKTWHSWGGVTIGFSPQSWYNVSSPNDSR